MTLRFAVLGAALFAGCAGGKLEQSLTAPSAAPAPDVYACVRDQLKAVGFTQSSFDADELRVTARKFNERARRPDVNFRRMVDRLEVDVSPGSGGEVSRITVVAKTFAELTTQRGPTEEQDRTSVEARAAAQTILDKCSGQSAPTEVVPAAPQG